MRWFRAPHPLGKWHRLRRVVVTDVTSRVLVAACGTAIGDTGQVEEMRGGTPPTSRTCRACVRKAGQ